MIHGIVTCIIGLFFIKTCTTSTCQNGRNNFSGNRHLKILRNDTVPSKTIYCSPDITHGKFPLHKGNISGKETVIGIYRRSEEESQICHYTKTTSLTSLNVDVNSLSGGELYTIGYISCPPGFLQLDVYCYSFNTSHHDFETHQRGCISKGGYMARMSDVHENTVIGEYIKRFSSRQKEIELFIGLKDTKGKDLPADHKWTQGGSTMIYSNWYPGEPNSDIALCTTMLTFHAGGPWYDTKCDAPWGAACEADIIQFY